MHFSIITAPTITEFRSPAELRSAAVQEASREPQLGPLTVAAVLERCGDVPHVFDANAEYMRFSMSGGNADTEGSADLERSAEMKRSAGIDGFADHLAEQAVQSNADVYGLSTICSTYPLTLRVARAIKQRRPYSMILLGGPQASVVDRLTLEAFPFIDFILRGEVEETLPALLGQWRGDYRYDRVAGLAYRDGACVVRTPNAPVIEDLDALPSPSYHLSSYLENGATTAAIELGRGCPFGCKFCSTNDFFRRRFRLRSPEKVLSEMRSIHERYGIRHFDLIHDMFTVDRKRVSAFCAAMTASGEGFTWNCSARTDCVDEALLEQMAASGCTSVFFGIESGSIRIQRIIDKHLDPARAERMVTAAERYSMKSTASLITGFPEENWDDLRDTLRIFTHAARCGRSHPQLNVLAPLAGTPIHTLHAHEMELEELCSDMSHQGLSFSPEDLDLIKAFPQIFPNFYMVPAPGLDRELLFELRQFLTLSLELFRPYLCLVAQLTDLLDFVRGWRKWRESEHGALAGGALRLYYVDGRFQRDFSRFLQGHALAADERLRALLLVDQALGVAARSAGQGAGVGRNAAAKQDPAMRRMQPKGLSLAAGAPLLLTDRVRTPEGCSVLVLPFELAALHAAIAASTVPRPQETCYAVQGESTGTAKLLGITPILASLLQACDGCTVGTALGRLSRSLPSEMTCDAEEFAVELLLGAQQAGWLQVTRELAVQTAAPSAESRNAPFSAVPAPVPHPALAAD